MIQCEHRRQSQGSGLRPPQGMPCTVSQYCLSIAHYLSQHPKASGFWETPRDPQKVGSPENPETRIGVSHGVTQLDPGAGNVLLWAPPSPTAFMFMLGRRPAASKWARHRTAPKPAGRLTASFRQAIRVCCWSSAVQVTSGPIYATAVSAM